MSATLRLLVALLLSAALGAFGALALSAPAQAAGSSCSGSGIDVVVDYGSLGGGVAQGCAPGAGSQTGDKAFDAAGYPLQYVPSQPGFVCAVAGKPAQCKMPGAGDPWWGVFWSDGTSGKWKTAMVGVNKLKVPADGSVAMVWESGKKVQKPSVPAPKAGDRPSASATASATPLATAGGRTNGTSGDAGDGGGFPAWAVVVIVVVLLGAGTAVALRRRASAA
jgi:hypothetical protein